MAGLIVMEPLPRRKLKSFHQFMAATGDLDMFQTPLPYPRMEVLSVPEILDGKRFETPTPMGRTQTAQPDLVT